MNNLMRVTFTGVDENTNLEQLKTVSSIYPYVEWGILYSENPSGRLGFNRFPSQQWFVENKEKIEAIKNETGASFALHICGGAVKTLLSGENVFLPQILALFNRVQINLIYKEKNLTDLQNLFLAYPDINFITQHNKANESLYGKVEAKNHQILFDSSGGRGITSDHWQNPLSDKLYGYAGGLGPENIKEQLINIEKASNNKQFWIDMENKVRTDDIFDLSKCEQVLVAVNHQILKNKATKFSV